MELCVTEKNVLACVERLELVDGVTFRAIYLVWICRVNCLMYWKGTGKVWREM